MTTRAFLAPQLEADPLEVLPREPTHRSSCVRRAGERDDAHVWVGDHRLTDVGAARQDVEQAAGQARLLEDPGDRDAGAHSNSRIGLQSTALPSASARAIERRTRIRGS